MLVKMFAENLRFDFLNYKYILILFFSDQKAALAAVFMQILR